MRDSLQGCIKMISETIADEGWNNGRIAGWKEARADQKNGMARFGHRTQMHITSVNYLRSFRAVVHAHRCA